MNLKDFNDLIFEEYGEFPTYNPLIFKKGLILCNGFIEGTCIGVFNQTNKESLWFLKKKNGTYRKHLTNKGLKNKNKILSISSTKKDFLDNVIEF